ncbi:TonB C-terminal domain-containing protein, partial [Geomonas sp.]|uniref:TonB C-terminal domain-containing protein n=1 Tax=Geomonas sp. TaxID=2651584 RepID=UPI002B494099
YRKKYRDLEQGDTRMIDTEDPLIGVYAHRLLLKAQDSVDMEGRRAPPRHNGVGVLQVTIRRDGSLEGVRIMEPSGNKDVDDFFIRSVYKTGYVGPLPKKWPHEKLNLVWVYSAHVMPGSP